MNNSGKLLFSRCSGANNTFFIANVEETEWKKIYPSLNKEQKQMIAKKLCGSFYGFRTDGLLFLHNYEKYDFAWDFFNSDGSFAEMCGNAARCASLYFYKRINSKNKIHFYSGAGDIQAEILGEQEVKVEMPKISSFQPMTVLGKKGIFVDTGVPHFVLEMSPDRELAKKLRAVSDFGKSGSNITFVENLQSDNIQAVTFERGVENYTQACGTGAVAAAIYYQKKKGAASDITVRMPGGTLKVNGAKVDQRPFLLGPAKIEFDLLVDKMEMIGN